MACFDPWWPDLKCGVAWFESNAFLPMDSIYRQAHIETSPAEAHPRSLVTERPVALPPVLCMGVTVVPEYRIVFLDPDSYIAQPPKIVECTDDQGAIKKARQFIDGHDIELWEKDRCIVRFARTSGK